MLLRVWQFRVRSGKTDEFRSAYGPTGAWAELFRHAAGFIGTELLQSTTEPDIYLTLDRWESAEAWATLLQAHPEDYAALDQQFDSLTLEEMEVGVFRSIETAQEAQ
jgi:heme-degrading monooxygenase HmoA